MKQKIKNTIAEYKFNDSKQMTWAVSIGNLLLAILFLAIDWTKVINDPRTITCLLIGSFFLIASLSYNWLSPEFNAFLTALYLSVFLFETLQLGIPESLINFSENGISKGLMFDLMVGLMPYVYIGLRLLLIIPLILVTVNSFKLRTVNVSSP